MFNKPLQLLGDEPAVDAVTVLLVSAHTDQTRVAALVAAGFAPQLADSAALAIKTLQQVWNVAVIVVDLALLTPALFERLEQPGAPRLLGLVDTASADVAGGLLGRSVAEFLPTNVDDIRLIAAIEAALAAPAVTHGVAEMSERGAAAIGALSTEVERIAAALALIAAGERRLNNTGGPPITALQLRGIIKARRLRDRFLPAELFQDPAWDMLLDLSAARLEEKPVSVSSLCIAAAVPTTTALRWIRTLCDSGMLVRQTDPNDARRAFIELSVATTQAMTDYLGSLRGEGPVI